MAYPLARYMRLMRGQVSEALTHAYVQGAPSRGLAETKAVRKHVMGNALLPIIAAVGVDIGTLVVGAN